MPSWLGTVSLGYLLRGDFFVGCSINSSSREFATSSGAGFQWRGQSWGYLMTSTSDQRICTSICWRKGSLVIINSFRRLDWSNTFLLCSSTVEILVRSASAAVKWKTSPYPRRSGLSFRSILLVLLLRELKSLFTTFRIPHFACSVFSGISKMCSLNFPRQLLNYNVTDQELKNLLTWRSQMVKTLVINLIK